MEDTIRAAIIVEAKTMEVATVVATKAIKATIREAAIITVTKITADDLSLNK